jgi:hypothetical protein
LKEDYGKSLKGGRSDRSDGSAVRRHRAK